MSQGRIGNGWMRVGGVFAAVSEELREQGSGGEGCFRA
jgi:hypothetical protein